ncbi:exported hypothetical protein [Cupriavidus neocaledonicus]|uniref:Transposase n=1 Tax=Cupriavidus neocaledonicus TaxID=1040979 RepID=A0ABY1V6N8_9BURK|nr:exported hypothetical protein [Cupriavidus neocaledonicus]
MFSRIATRRMRRLKNIWLRASARAITAIGTHLRLMISTQSGRIITRTGIRLAMIACCALFAQNSGQNLPKHV